MHFPNWTTAVGAPALVATGARLQILQAASADWTSWDLKQSQVAELELLLNGAFAPLDRYLDQIESEAVSRLGQLLDGTPWSTALTLMVSEEAARGVRRGDRVGLRDAEGVLLAVLYVTDIWAVAEGTGWYAGGRVEGVALPRHHDHPALRCSPADVREEVARRGWHGVLAVFLDSILDCGLEWAIGDMVPPHHGVLLFVPSGSTGPLGPEEFARIEAITAAADAAFGSQAMVVLVPLGIDATDAAAWGRRAVVAGNYGAVGLAVTDDQALAAARRDEGPSSRGAIGVELVRLPAPLWNRDEGRFEAPVRRGDESMTVTTRDVVSLVRRGAACPEWLLRPCAARVLARAYPTRRQRGFTVFFTGLSGAGKSTIAAILRLRLLERTGRAVTVLDGDLVRKHLTSELGFSPEHRHLNIVRIGFVASEITRHRGIVLCAAIAPYAASRQSVRELVEPVGGFLLVHVVTPLHVCEQRDRKGLYAKARRGLLQQFTGVSDTYEPPSDAALAIDTSVVSAEAAAAQVIEWLVQEDYLA